MNFDELINQLSENFTKELKEKISVTNQPFTSAPNLVAPKAPVKNKVFDDLFESVKWLKLIKHPCVILIIGNRGSGKSALSYKLLEYMRWQGKIYVVGLPEKARKILPDWIGSIPALEDAPPDSIILIDESYLSLHARSSSSQHARDSSNLINLSRQRGQTLIFVSQEARQIDKNIASSANAVIIKNPGILQIDFERVQFRKLLAEAIKMFAAIDKDKNKWSYVYAPEASFAGMMENSIPSFWTPSLSKAYADAKPTAEVRTPTKTTREDRITKVRDLRKQGFSLGEIAKIQGISKSTAKNYLDSYPYKKKLKIWPPG
jgi:DNA-binding NarL/FixJ family response regulator